MIRDFMQRLVIAKLVALAIVAVIIVGLGWQFVAGYNEKTGATRDADVSLLDVAFTGYVECTDGGDPTLVYVRAVDETGDILPAGEGWGGVSPRGSIVGATITFTIDDTVVGEADVFGPDIEPGATIKWPIDCTP